ncbi:folate-binding protein [Rhodobacteraceae bacterium RKSG542]|uniref:CAF17-like 4Fe-4S cluster assembly/insertion protein YgfZ n=1 Tax=Pseudovibrio flavus TaxID=2529854 RepID=UPI0012BC7108|nr:folate-binding protein YgfZ [Pseudovibrio flavus]MTI18713.1 folate-binding protein [Pseudovibrio flavus]
MAFNAVILEDRALLKVEGAEAEHFLQNLVSADISQLEVGKSAFTALLTPQGKILWDFFIFKTAPDGFLIDAPKQEVDALQKRLTLYKLRSKLTISPDDSAMIVAAFWGEDSPQYLPADPRLAALGARAILSAEQFGELSKTGTVVDKAAYDTHRVQLGIAESITDFALGDVFPHDVNMDELGGVGFKKGCFVGQEVVSRMKHRGTARKRVVIVEADGPLPVGGGEIYAGEKPVGTMGPASGNHAVAVIRLDRAKTAMDQDTDLMVDETKVRLSIPQYATFNWPQNQD